MEPFTTQHAESIRASLSLNDDIQEYFWTLANKAAVFAPSSLGPHHMVTYRGLPVGGVFAPVDSKRQPAVHGVQTSFLTGDAVFGRYDHLNDEIYVQDKIAEEEAEPPRDVPPASASAGGGAAPLGAEDDENEGATPGQSGDDGRRPGVLPFRAARPLPGASVSDEVPPNVRWMGPDEHTLIDPYCVIIRGSGFGKDMVLNEHFAFSGDHWHISDHRGGFTGLQKPDHLRSTRIYDINPDTRKPWTDEGEPWQGEFVRGYNAGLDRVVKVYPEFTGCAGGDGADNTLALNFGGATGQAHGLAVFQSGRPFFPAGTGGRDTVVRTPSQDVLAFLSYGQGGPLTAGHPTGDKHKVGDNVDGDIANSAHIHINAKYTNDSIKYDGRLNFVPVNEPPVGASLIPVRVHLQWNPGMADPHLCGDEDGGWDLWTTVPRLIVEPPVEQEEPEDGPGAKPGEPDAGPGEKEPDGGGGDKEPDGGGGEKPPDDDWTPQRVPRPGPVTGDPPTEVGVVEERKPSDEHQPKPGNTEDPKDRPVTGDPPGDASLPPVGDDGHVPPQDAPASGSARGGHSRVPGQTDGEFAALQREISRQARESRDTNRDNMLMHVTGLTISDHMKSPLIGHETSFYEHVQAAPIEGRSGLERFLPNYNVEPEYFAPTREGQRDRLKPGTANGVHMAHPFELKSYQLRHDYPDHKKPAIISNFTKGIYEGVTLAFGKLGDKWGEVVDGFRLKQTGADLKLTPVNTAGAADFTKTLTLGEYTLPLSDGNADQALITDGNGSVTWQDVAGGGDDHRLYAVLTADSSTNGTATMANAGLRIENIPTAESDTGWWAFKAVIWTKVTNGEEGDGGMKIDFDHSAAADYVRYSAQLNHTDVTDPTIRDKEVLALATDVTIWPFAAGETNDGAVIIEGVYRAPTVEGNLGALGLRHALLSDAIGEGATTQIMKGSWMELRSLD